MVSDVYITLRLVGDFVPDDITRRLGLIPTDKHERGDVVGNGLSGRRHEAAGWYLDSHPAVKSGRIEPHLAWLLDSLEPQAAVLAELVAEDVRADVDCFWSSPGMSGGPWIAPETMSRLGALQLPLLISFYAVESEPG